jgi:hypothetical protein
MKFCKVYLLFNDGYTLTFLCTPDKCESYINRITHSRPAKHVSVKEFIKLPQSEKEYWEY